MIPGTTIATMALACAQGAPPAPPDEGWKEFDRVVMIVNEDLVSGRTFSKGVARESKKHPLTSEAAIRQALLSKLVTDMISVQAGQDMGLDPALVQRQAKEYLERQLARFDSSEAKAAYLQSIDVTLHEAEDEVKDQLYAQTWRDWITGEGAVGPGLRPSRDRYVRPGYLGFAWRNCLERPELLPRIGGKPRAVVLQLLFVDPQSSGGEEQARSLALQLRQRILDGEDMGDLVKKYSAEKQTQRGMTEPLDEVRLAQINPPMGSFLSQARPGDLSEVLPFKISTGQVYLSLVRLVERTEPVVPDFDLAEVQQKISERVRSDLADVRREDAYKVAFRASYVWPPELAAR